MQSRLHEYESSQENQEDESKEEIRDKIRIQNQTLSELNSVSSS